MKKYITIFLLTFTTLLNAQNFEGTLQYVTDIQIVSQKMIDLGMTYEIIKSKMKNDGSWVDSVQITYKNGFYKQLNFSMNKYWLVYRSDSNKFYTFQEGEASDVCVINDASIDQEQKMTGKYPTVVLLDTVINYKEYKLQMVEVKWKSGTYFYLFDKEYFTADPNNFKGHIQDGFYEYLKVARSLPIVIIKRVGKVMVSTQSLVQATEHKVKNAVFQIPKLKEDAELNFIKIGGNKMMRIVK